MSKTLSGNMWWSTYLASMTVISLEMVGGVETDARAEQIGLKSDFTR